MIDLFAGKPAATISPLYVDRMWQRLKPLRQKPTALQPAHANSERAVGSTAILM